MWVVLSKIDSYSNKGSFKYFTGYIDTGNILPIPLCKKLPQINGYVKYFDSNNKNIIFLVHDKELLQKYNEICVKSSNLFKKGFDSEPVYNGKYVKVKIKFTIIK